MKLFEFRLKFHWNLLPRVPINNIPALVQIMAWRRPGDKPLSEAMMVRLLTHIWVARSQWVTPLVVNYFLESYLQFLPEASFGLRVLSLPASVRVGVNHELVRAITCHWFQLESPNLNQTCKTTSVAYRYRKSISIIELFVSIYISIWVLGN